MASPTIDHCRDSRVSRVLSHSECFLRIKKRQTITGQKISEREDLMVECKKDLWNTKFAKVKIHVQLPLPSKRKYISEI